MPNFAISGRVLDIEAGRIFPAAVEVEAGRIAAVREGSDGSAGPFLLPGFVDAHVHVESSMMAPSEFARFATVHGTVATVSDPHEIANVLGAEGIRLMVEKGRRVPFKFHFGAPACVPATPFETAGAVLDAAAVRGLFERQGLRYLAEMMNFPAVLRGDPDTMAKLQAARDLGLPIDGHAPGLRGDEVRRVRGADPRGETDWAPAAASRCLPRPVRPQRRLAAMGVGVIVRSTGSRSRCGIPGRPRWAAPEGERTSR